MARNAEALTRIGVRTRRRKAASGAAISLGVIALALVIVPSVWIVAQVAFKALPHMSWSVITTPGVGLGGGLQNEIVGTLLITFGVAVVAGFIGVMSGIYLSQFAHGRAASVLRGASEVLAGIPSIVVGYVGYISLVVAFHWGFSLGAGLITLSVMVVPYIAKTTEVSLRQVPSSYVEGAEALGLRPGQILRTISLRSALPGIVTGLIVALAISVGETAPLLYTAGYSQNLPHLSLTHSPLGYLTYAVWTFYNEPSAHAVQLSFDAAFLLIVLVLALITASRIVVAMASRHRESA
ncbi:MAG: ABC transporter permease subunit [Actinomycetota bacterium]|nr:ABC transporter permease subunit [Actinomycetota bacterium]MDA8209274.1 ABC transporter permease subunit [Actinomycetota bacterium]